MVARDLLRCGVVERVLQNDQARLVLLTPGVRDPAFVAEFGDERVSIVPQHAYTPSPMYRLLMFNSNF